MENKYKREVDSDVLGVYSGTDELGRNSLFVKLKNKPSFSFESNLLKSKAILRKDKQWALQVSLTDNNYIGVFRALINDLVSVVAKETIQAVAERKLIQRYSEWQHLFERARKEMLSELQIQGLLGELYFLSFKLMPHMGVDLAVSSWLGPEAGNRDFQLENTWIEVKTKSVNKHTVTISNKDQLVSDQEGFLTVISVEKTSELNSNSYNILSLHRLICSQISDKNIEKKYFEKITKMNFIPNDTYEQYSYSVREIQYFLVNKCFPTIKIPEDGSITNLKYEINLPKIKDFEKEEDEWKNIEQSS